jgi:uncharacterized protein with HEPN domain
VICRDISYLERIGEETKFILISIAGVTEELFLSDSILQHAVCMSLITIGECANHISNDFKEKHADIEWVQIIAVRNIAAHGYWQLDMKQIWQAVINDIPMIQTFVNELCDIC